MLAEAVMLALVVMDAVVLTLVVVDAVFEADTVVVYETEGDNVDVAKFAKKVQAAKLAERKESKKQHSDALDKWRSRNKEFVLLTSGPLFL